MSYKERVDRVIDFIGKHLEEELELDELCRIACFSKYHFHRLFTAYTGLPLMGYIKWLRLKRAAHQLIVHKEGVLREDFGQQIFEKAYQRRFINFNMMWRFLELSQILGVIT